MQSWQPGLHKHTTSVMQSAPSLGVHQVVLWTRTWMKYSCVELRGGNIRHGNVICLPYTVEMLTVSVKIPRMQQICPYTEESIYNIQHHWLNVYCTLSVVVSSNYSSVLNISFKSIIFDMTVCCATHKRTQVLIILYFLYHYKNIEIYPVVLPMACACWRYGISPSPGTCWHDLWRCKGCGSWSHYIFNHSYYQALHFNSCCCCLSVAE